MSNAIDRPGTFRGRPTEWGVSESKGGYPQFVVRIAAQEYYDEQAGQYIPWSEYDQEITGYLVLYTQKDGQWVELLNAEQIKKALGWDGKSFESLANGQYTETIVLFRVEESVYNGSTSLKLSWLDAADASPTKNLPKYDASKLKAMNEKFAGVLKGGTPTPTPAKAGKPAAPPRGKPGRPPKAGGTAPAAAPSTTTPQPAGAAPAPSAPSTGTTKPPPTTSTPATTVPETKESAWAAVNACPKDEAKLAEVWVREATKIGKDEASFTPADWTALKEAVLKETSMF